ncbi:hypothetical protein Pcinc_037121 [Petrolisthes cinctipes]|uniref:Uncharacterized protein n=1 Tax=Petrolisthes cinctipes TaxID=88211 RepID=A0AAE1BUP5_PETCI|nr:hypothetical protein Pcinc_037121 [Petrolisthes cinctipes]
MVCACLSQFSSFTFSRPSYSSLPSLNPVLPLPSFLLIPSYPSLPSTSSHPTLPHLPLHPVLPLPSFLLIPSYPSPPSSSSHPTPLLLPSYPSYPSPPSSSSCSTLPHLPLYPVLPLPSFHLILCCPSRPQCRIPDAVGRYLSQPALPCSALLCSALPPSLRFSLVYISCHATSVMSGGSVCRESQPLSFSTGLADSLHPTFDMHPGKNSCIQCLWMK